MVMWGSASSSIRLMVDLPAPDGEERTISSPRRLRWGARRVGSAMRAVALAVGIPSSGTPNSILLCNAQKPLISMTHCTMLHRSKGSFDVADETKVEEKIEAVEAAAAPVKAVAEKAKE